MKDTLIDMNDLSDTKELLLMTPSFLITMFTVSISIFLLIAIIWMQLSKIDIYVRAAGTVRTNEAISRLLVIGGGRIANIYASDGEFVHKGDMLFTFDQQSLYIQRDILTRDIELAQTELEMLRLYRSSIDQLENHLINIDTDKARAYSNKVKSFLWEREITLTQASESEKDKVSKLSNAREALNKLLAEQTWLQRYKGSVQNGQDIINSEPGDSELKSNYAARYQKYRADLDVLEGERRQAQDNLDYITRLMQLGQATGAQVDEAQNKLNEAADKITSFWQAELADIDNKNAVMDASISDAREAVSAAEQEAAKNSEGKITPLMQAEQARIQLLSQIDSEIQQSNESINKLNAENNSLDAQFRESMVIAPIDGTLNLNSVLNEGDIIAPGTGIGAIIPPESDSFKVELQVSNRDIANVKLNQQIKIKFLALPYQEYGMADGFISYITADSQVNPQTGESFYIIEAILENKPIKSNRGVDENIRVGMAVEGRIISDQKTVLRWLLEQLNFM